MPRRRRLKLAGIPQHVVQRGNNRQATFFEQNDYRHYLQCLSAAATKHGCLVHAYVLMTNHVHLLVTPGSPDALALGMRDVSRDYSKYLNWSRNRTGTLWQGRYRASLVDAALYFLACCRYIDLNPVRAGLVARPQDYCWSSHRYYAYGDYDPCISPHDEYHALGDASRTRQQAYRQLFDVDYSATELAEIRTTVQRGLPLGSEQFKDELSINLAQPARPLKRGRPFRTSSGLKSLIQS